MLALSMSSVFLCGPADHADVEVISFTPRSKFKAELCDLFKPKFFV